MSGDPSLISLKKEMESLKKALAFSETRYREVVDTANSVILRLEQDGKITFFNSFAQKFFGFSEDEILGKPAVGTIVPETETSGRNLADLIFKICADPDNYCVNENENIKKNGERVWIAWTNKAITDETGQVREVLCIGNDVTATRRAHKTLDMERRQLISIFDSIDEPIYVSDPETYEVLYTNAALRKLLGDAAGKKCHEAFQGLDKPCPFCTNSSLFGKNAVSSYVWNQRNLVSGRWFRCMDKAIRWPDGRMVRYEMAVDITERMRSEELLQDAHNELAEANRRLRADIEQRQKAQRELLESQEALLESEEKFRLAFENAVDAIFWADPITGRILNCNKAAEALLETSRERIIGRHQTVLHPPQKAVLYMEMFRRHFQTPRIADEEAEVITESGFVKPVHITACATVIGKKIIHQGIFRDITHRKRAEDALRASEARYRSLLEFSPDPISVYDNEGRVMYVNPVFEETFGWKLGELIGKRINFVPDENWPETRDAIDRMKAGEKVLLFETRRFTKEGRILDVQISSSVFYGADGKTAGNVVFLRDITRRKTLEEELLQAKKLEATGVLAGGLAHDFGNLLAVLVLNIELARSRISEGDPSVQFMEDAMEACHRARDLTYKFITFSPGGSPHKTLVSLHELLADCMKLCDGVSDITCSATLPEDLWKVSADRRQMKTVFTEILRNAMESMPDGGTIGLSAENIEIDEKAAATLPNLPPGRYVKAVISDRGKGIPVKNLPRVFDPYFSTKERGTQKGMGLGLSIAWSVVKRHGGTIKVETGPNGTDVMVFLPASGGL